MISHIFIRNFGLIDELKVDFSFGLTVFTGETGVGKSILIDALRFCLGEKLSTVQVRDQDKPCTVEAVFEPPQALISGSPLLEELISHEEQVLIIQRTRLADGKTKNRINGMTVTLTQLKETGNLLVDFHGPHDHQMLFSQDSHLSLLDRLCPCDDIRDEYASLFTQYSGLQKELDRLQSLSRDRTAEQDLLSARIKELEEVPLTNEAYESLIQERNRINNTEKIYACTNELLSILEDETSGLKPGLARAFSPLKTLSSIDSYTDKFRELAEQISDDSSELISLIQEYISSLSFEPEQAEEINRRYTCYYQILRQYGPSLDEARAFYEQAKEKYDLLLDMEHNTGQLQKQIKDCRGLLLSSAEKITIMREKTAAGLKKTIESELNELGIANVRFECRVAAGDLRSTGQDTVVFYISPNLGEDLKPLSEIVSSGEAARVMLALKKALTEVDPIPVLIFDEIDAQIGGRLGTVTGKKLKELSSGRQVILITHLPQIASFADLHFKVSKAVRDGRTLTQVKGLDKEDRVKELAQMMSGKKETRVALDHASDMLAKAENPPKNF